MIVAETQDFVSIHRFYPGSYRSYGNRACVVFCRGKTVELCNPFEVPSGRENHFDFTAIGLCERFPGAYPEKPRIFCLVDCYVDRASAKIRQVEARIEDTLVFEIRPPARERDKGFEIKLPAEAIENRGKFLSLYQHFSSFGDIVGCDLVRQSNSEPGFLQRFANATDARRGFVHLQGTAQLCRKFMIGIVDPAAREDRRAARKGHVASSRDHQQLRFRSRSAATKYYHRCGRRGRKHFLGDVGIDHFSFLAGRDGVAKGAVRVPECRESLQTKSR